MEPKDEGVGDSTLDSEYREHRLRTGNKPEVSKKSEEGGILNIVIEQEVMIPTEYLKE